MERDRRGNKLLSNTLNQKFASKGLFSVHSCLYYNLGKVCFQFAYLFKNLLRNWYFIKEQNSFLKSGVFATEC